MKQRLTNTDAEQNTYLNIFRNYISAWAPFFFLIINSYSSKPLEGTHCSRWLTGQKQSGGSESDFGLKRSPVVEIEPCWLVQRRFSHMWWPTCEHKYFLPYKADTQCKCGPTCLFAWSVVNVYVQYWIFNLLISHLPCVTSCLFTVYWLGTGENNRALFFVCLPCAAHYYNINPSPVLMLIKKPHLWALTLLMNNIFFLIHLIFTIPFAWIFHMNF